MIRSTRASSAASGAVRNVYAAPSSTLYTSESLYSAPWCGPCSTPAVRAKFAMRPVSSHLSRHVPTVTRRFVSIRGFQNESAIATRSNGTGSSAPCPSERAPKPPDERHATNERANSNAGAGFISRGLHAGLKEQKKKKNNWERRESAEVGI